MVAREPGVRRRGFFLHTPESGEPDTGEHENPEGFVVRFGHSRNPPPRQMTGFSSSASGTRASGGRQLRVDCDASEGQPVIRSGSVTGSRQRLD